MVNLQHRKNMRKNNFVNGEYYHVFNRGVDKRKIIMDEEDSKRFFNSIKEFNVTDPIGSIYENTFRKKKLGGSTSKFANIKSDDKMVNFICYCVNPNHYHFLLEQVSDNGIEKFMQRLGTGYTMFFNNKYHRSGSLFQGRYKSTHIDSNDYLIHLSAYINLNDKVHRLGGSTSKSSANEYFNNIEGFCKKDIILGQFRNMADYKEFAENLLIDIRDRKDMEKILLE